MTEQELISKLQSLKRVQPSKEWVGLTKSQILGESVSVAPNAIPAVEQVGPRSFGSAQGRISFRQAIGYIFNVGMPMKVAYAFAAFIFVMAGTFGMMSFMTPESGTPNNNLNISQEAPKLLAIKGSMETLKEKSQNLLDVARTQPENFSLAVKEMTQAADDLTHAIENDPELAKEVAVDVANNQTLLALVSESEVEAASENLYKTIAGTLIAELEETIIDTEEATELVEELETATIDEDDDRNPSTSLRARKIFEESKELFKAEKYSEALEKLLIINQIQAEEK